MGLTVKETGSDIEPVPEGVYVAVCYAIFDLGTHYSERWNKSTHKVLICWEIPQVRMDFERDGRMENLPRAISQRYTMSLHAKANLRKDLEAWRGQGFTAEELEGFDLQKVLGAACQIQVVHTHVDNKVYGNISAVMGLPKDTRRPVAENPLTFFSFEDTGEPPENTPEWVVKLIADSEEHKAMEQAATLGGGEAPGGMPGGPIGGEPVEEDEDNLPF